MGPDIVTLIAEDDWVAAPFVLGRTWWGDYLGHCAEGKTVSVTGMSFNRFAGGRMIEGHIQWDRPGLVEQLNANGRGPGVPA